MASLGLADLLGVGGKRIRWERPFLFFAALFVSQIIIQLVLSPSVSSSPPYSYKFFHFADSFSWLSSFVTGIALVLASSVAFRWLRIEWLAVLAASILCVVLGQPVVYLLHAIARPHWASYRTMLLDPVSLGYLFLYEVFLLGGIVLGLRVIRRPWLALLCGSVAGILVESVLGYVLQSFRAMPVDLMTSLMFLPFRLLRIGVFAIVFYGLLRMTSGPMLSAGQEKQRISRGFFLGTIATANGVPGLIFLAIIAFSVYEVWRREDLVPTLILWALACIMAIYGSVVFCKLIYRMWKAIQDGNARTTPGRAVGLLFVPFFNFYWAFQAFAGFARDYNAYAQRHAPSVARLAPGIFTTYAVLCLVALVPVVFWVTAPAAFIVGLVMVSKITNAVNALPPTEPPPASAS
jgi:hypothetical protein